jgi:hypothetical protein
LHEREGRERERDDVEREAAGLEREADEPAPISQQQRRGVKRPPEGERGQGGGRVVLAEVRDVDQGCGGERQQQRDGGLSAQRSR